MLRRAESINGLPTHMQSRLGTGRRSRPAQLGCGESGKMTPQPTQPSAAQQEEQPYLVFQSIQATKDAGLLPGLGRILPRRPLDGRRGFWRRLTGVSRILRGRERARRLLVLAGRRRLAGQAERTMLLILTGRRVLLGRRVLRWRERIPA